MFGYIGVI